VALSAQSDGRHCPAIQQNNLAECQEFTDDHEVGTVVIPKGTERRQMSLYGGVVGSGVPMGGGFKPPARNSERPPKSCQTQSDCENC